MKIYPDPELPDIVVRWSDFDCMEGTGEVRVAVYSFDGFEPILDTTVACTALEVEVEDVARERYRVDATLSLRDDEYPSRGIEVDLRDGVNELVDVYFDTFSNLRITWTLPSNTTCAAFGTPLVAIDYGVPGEPTFEFSNETPCEFSPYSQYFPPGARRIRGRALSGMSTRAISPAVEVVIPPTGRADVMLELAACDPCPLD